LTDIYKPIFIVGSPRSGTTMLYDFLAGHKDVAWFSQHDFIENYSQEYRRFLDLRRRIFSVRKWHYLPGGDETRLRTTFEIPEEFGHFWNKWIGKEGWADATDANPKVIQNLTNAISSLLDKKNKKRFLSKSPAHSVRMLLLQKVFPDALFINIIRDGRAVVSSMIKAAGGKRYLGVRLKDGKQMEFDMIERHARQWIELNEEIQKAKNSLRKDQYLELKYEDFIEKPNEYLNEIFEFCELEKQNIFENPMIRFDKRKPTFISNNLHSRNDKWKKSFTTDEINKLQNIIEKELQRFEYS